MTNQNKNKVSFIKKIAVTAASLAALFIGSNAIAYAATGTTWVSGFFKDTTRWDGAEVYLDTASADISAQITGGSAQLSLPVAADALHADTIYTLHIKSLYGSSKADAPLLIHGDWTCILP